jgi:hypothetical protein
MVYDHYFFCGTLQEVVEEEDVLEVRGDTAGCAADYYCFCGGVSPRLVMKLGIESGGNGNGDVNG